MIQSDERARQGKLPNCEFHLVLRAPAPAGLAAEPCGQRIFELGVLVRARNRASARLCLAAAVGSAKGTREGGGAALDCGDYLNTDGQGDLVGPNLSSSRRKPSTDVIRPWVLKKSLNIRLFICEHAVAGFRVSVRLSVGRQNRYCRLTEEAH